MWITASPDTIQTPTCIALGNFDGIHLGHRQVIQPILPAESLNPSHFPLSSRELLQHFSTSTVLSHLASPLAAKPVEAIAHSGSQELGIPLPISSRSIEGLDGKDDGKPDPGRRSPISTVVTFSPHPQEFFTGLQRPLLTPLAEKAALLQMLGVQQWVLLPFDRALADLTPQDFVEEILIRRLQVRTISVGQDFCFGRQRSGTVEDLKAIATAFGAQVEIAPLQKLAGDRISSSAIRLALQSGQLDYATRLLGRPYTLIGEVIQGQQLGRKLGFPTANLKLPAEKFLPCRGVYAVRVWDFSESSSAKIMAGVMNIGLRPTVDGLAQTLEVHLLDWQGNLYGHTLGVTLEAFLRPEQKFESLTALTAQIQQDCDRARSLLSASSP